MSKPEISGIAPFFIVRNVPAALSFYPDRLGFDVTFQGPSDDDIFFGIVQRGAAMIMLKAVGVEPVPNYTRDIKKGIARWDAYLQVPDPDALAAEFESRNVELFLTLNCAAIGRTPGRDSTGRRPAAGTTATTVSPRSRPIAIRSPTYRQHSCAR